MKKKLKLAIVGRPNVGKSALFNCICKKKIAIVDEAEGITRDRLYSQTELFGMPFEVIDTGGIHTRSKVMFNEQIKEQALIAIEEADTIVMVVDSKIGPTDLDREVSRILLRTKKPVCLAVNKIDNVQEEHKVYDFNTLGIKDKVPVSAAQNWHIAELLETAFKSFPRETVEEEVFQGIKVAIVGRPNVGKSSLVNYLLDEDRCIVSPIPGTTRDSIDVSFEKDGRLYSFIDTAGIRRKGAEKEVVDKFAFIRTEKSIEKADIVVLMIDAQDGLTVQEKRIANKIEEAGKGCILLVNKWDLIHGFKMEHCLRGIREEAPFLDHCPKMFISAKTGRNIDKIFPLIESVYSNSLQRITTGELNQFIEKSMQRIHPPMLGGKRLRIYYMAQVGIQPPTFVLFVNHKDLMTESYKKYLYNQFRETYQFTGCPLIFRLRGKKKQSAEERKEDKTKKLLRAPVIKQPVEDAEEEEDFHSLDFETDGEDDIELDPSFFSK